MVILPDHDGRCGGLFMCLNPSKLHSIRLPMILGRSEPFWSSLSNLLNGMAPISVRSTDSLHQTLGPLDLVLTEGMANLYSAPKTTDQPIVSAALALQALLHRINLPACWLQRQGQGPGWERVLARCRYSWGARSHQAGSKITTNTDDVPWGIIIG